jgi:hypothetical protein
MLQTTQRDHQKELEKIKTEALFHGREWLKQGLQKPVAKGGTSSSPSHHVAFENSFHSTLNGPQRMKTIVSKVERAVQTTNTMKFSSDQEVYI